MCAGDKTNIATFFVAPDYLAIGSDENYFLAPISPGTAQRIADKLNCVLPTRKMVDAIYAAAEVKLAPAPIPPSAAMTTVPVFAQHNETIRAQRMALTNSHPLGALVAGHKKDVVISARLAGVTNKVAIYGWHQTNGVAIQPLYLGHVSWWVDYSQCIRLVSQTMLVNGEKKPSPRFWLTRNSADSSAMKASSRTRAIRRISSRRMRADSDKNHDPAVGRETRVPKILRGQKFSAVFWRMDAGNQTAGRRADSHQCAGA